MAPILCPAMPQKQAGELTDCGEQLNSLLLPNGSCHVNQSVSQSEELCVCFVRGIIRDVGRGVG